MDAQVHCIRFFVIFCLFRNLFCHFCVCRAGIIKPAVHDHSEQQRARGFLFIDKASITVFQMFEYPTLRCTTPTMLHRAAPHRLCCIAQQHGETTPTMPHRDRRRPRRTVTTPILSHALRAGKHFCAYAVCAGQEGRTRGAASWIYFSTESVTVQNQSSLSMCVPLQERGISDCGSMQVKKVSSYLVVQL